jgi:hypothetical protein
MVSFGDSYFRPHSPGRRLAMCALLDTKKIDPKPKITPIAYSHCHKKNTSPRKHGSNQTKRSSLNGRESTTRASIN